MSWKYIFHLGYRNLINRKSRSLLTIGGVGIGIAAIIFLVSLGYGLQYLAIRDTLQSKSLNLFDVKIGTGNVEQIDSSLITEIKSLNHVEELYPQLETPAKLSLKNSDSKVDLIALINNTTYVNQSDIRLRSGDMFSDDKAEAIITSAALKQIGLSETDSLSKEISLAPIIRSEYRSGDRTDLPSIAFKVVGIIDDSENPYVSIPIDPVSKEMGEFGYSAAKIAIDDKANVDTVRQQTRDLGLEDEYVGDMVTQLESIFSTVRLVLAGFGLIATFVAALGMFNTLSVSLLERTREIGIMKTLGTRNGDVRKLFLIEGLLISILGGVAGILIGVVAGEGLNLAYNILAKSTGHVTSDFYYSPPVFLLIILGLVTILGLLVGLIPARRATSISPIQALRYE